MATPLSVIIAVSALAVILCVYGFLKKDTQLFTHILSALFSGILFLIIGYSIFGGIIYATEPAETIWQSEVYGSLFVMWGIFMCIYTIGQLYYTTQEVLARMKDRETPAWKIRSRERRGEH